MTCLRIQCRISTDIRYLNAYINLNKHLSSDQPAFCAYLGMHSLYIQLVPHGICINMFQIQWTLVITTLFVTKDLAVKSNLLL